LKTSFTDAELGVPNPEFYRRVWDSVDIAAPSVGEESGGFFILTNVLITANQTRGSCPEDETIEGAVCTSDKNCLKGRPLKLGHGIMTGKCVLQTHSPYKTCEIEAWCPVEKKHVKHFPL